MRKAKIVVLEGTWWSNHEVPLVLPYFQALSISHNQIDISHRTIRNVDDIGYYVSRIPSNAGVFLYFACHGSNLGLEPSGRRDRVEFPDLLNALERKKRNSISFIHFGCCEMVDAEARRQTHQEILDASGARWASGYTQAVDWLQSMLLDLALVTEVFVPQQISQDGRVTQLKKKATQFVKTYELLARSLGFSALSRLSTRTALFPSRLSKT